MNSATTGRPGRQQRWVLAGLVALMSGCATTQPVSGPQYVPGSGYHMVMAEIAAQRGEYPTAAAEYLNAAERSEDPELSQRAAAFAFEFGFDAYALRAARRWAQLVPDSPSAHLYVARLLIRRNDVADAVAAAERALEGSGRRHADDYVLLAGEIGQEDNAEAVTRVLTRLAANAPDEPVLDLVIGRAALRSGDLDLALESAYATLAQPVAEEVAADASLLIGRVLLARGAEDAALEHMARMLEPEPSLELSLENARLLAAAGRHDESLQELDALGERFGPQPDLQRLRALVSFDAGDFEAAWEGFGQLLREGEFGDECLFYLGGISEQQGRWKQAVELLSRVPDGPYLLPAEATLSRILEEQEGADAALLQLAEFAASNPRFGYQTDRLRAGVLQRAGRPQEARALFDRALVYRPHDADLLLARGALLEQMNELEPALADMRQAVAITPDNAAALNALGYTLANRTRHIDEAHRLIRRAIEREPDNAAILDSYGWVLYRQGKLDEARSYLQLAYSQFPDPEVAAHLGEVMWRQGEKEPARRLWEEAAQTAPGNPPLRDTMSRFLN